MTTASPSQVRPNYRQDSEAAIHRQINPELYASYVYLSIACLWPRVRSWSPGIESCVGLPAWRLLLPPVSLPLSLSLSVYHK
uniref:Ferritin n=1 Tax=Canis lupus familiaris TaxID=9615 RepID=A0A8C0Z0A7_CANLF